MIPGRQTAGDNADDEKEQARLDTRVPCERGRGLNGQHRRTKNEPLHYSLVYVCDWRHTQLCV